MSGELPIYAEAFSLKKHKIIEVLKEKGIQARPYYPNLDRASYFKASGKFPASRKFEEQAFFLPCGPDQTVENLQKTVNALREFENQE